MLAAINSAYENQNIIGGQTGPAETAQPTGPAPEATTAVLEPVEGEVFSAEAQGYEGPVYVEVTVKEDGSITALKVGDERFAETPGFGAKALEPEFGAYIGRVCENAVVLASSIAQSGARIVSGGTDTHLALVDLSPLGISGREAETWLDRANITVNKNSIPFDDKSPFVTSGIRVGTAALTTRGMGRDEMLLVGALVGDAVKHGIGHEIAHGALLDPADFARSLDGLRRCADDLFHERLDGLFQFGEAGVDLGGDGRADRVLLVDELVGVHAGCSPVADQSYRSGSPVSRLASTNTLQS